MMQSTSFGILAWNVSDLVSCRERLMKLGVDTTEIKKGVKEGTLVKDSPWCWK